VANRRGEMAEIKVERNPDRKRLEELGVFRWPIWEKEESEFLWHYDEPETCYFLEGEVVVTPREGEPVRLQAGDLVTFPAGLSCTWKILKKVRKHYR
jgi:uncharacterized cupin superfamily protein